MKVTARSILLSLLFFLFYFLFFISPVSAQQPNPQVNPYLNPNTNPDVPKNLHTWTQTVMIEVMSAMSCQLTGIDPTDPKGKCLGVDPKTGNIGFVEGGGGAIGVAGKMIAMLYTPPLHTSDYFRYLASNFGIAKPAHAAGFEGLKPIQSLWKAFRDIVYLLFVIIFIIIGLAIMLRVRIDPRTVMTIQNQIPRIIIGLLLVTFSFAIAGFLIDMMYVVIFLSYEAIAGAIPSINLDELNPLVLQGATPFKAANEVQDGGIFGIAFETSKAVFWIIDKLLSELISGNIVIQSIVGGIVTVVSAFFVGFFAPIIGAIAGSFAGEALGKLLGFLGGMIAFLIVVVALLFALIRLWFALIMAYIGILLNVVFAPFWIAASLLPGSPIGFTAWLRSIIANLAVFPATIIMFLLAKIFIDSFGQCSLPACDPNTVFVPPLIGGLPGTDSIGAIIGLGIIFMTPGVVAMVKAALRAPSIPGTGLIGAAIGTGVSPYMSGGRAVAAARTKYPAPDKPGGWGAAARTIFRF